MSKQAIKQFIRDIPVVGELAKSVNDRITGNHGTEDQPAAQDLYVFERMAATEAEGPEEWQLRRLENVLNYTKLSQSSYSAKIHPAGYHTIDFHGHPLSGQRNPASRISQIPMDFSDKVVLDIGCNQGGMLHELSSKISAGIGIDYDARMVNAANWISRELESNNLSFFVFDLENDELDLIEDLSPTGKVDVVFLLSVCMWIKNWRDVISKAASLSTTMIFETNGSESQQEEQELYLRATYSNVQVLAEKSEDDPGQKLRRLLMCTNGSD